MRPHGVVYDPQSGENTLTVQFPGSVSGYYMLYVIHQRYGFISTINEQLHVGPVISGVSTLEGSLYGGTRVTISGTNFEQGCQIYINFDPCVVVSVTATEMVVETPATYQRDETGAFVPATADLYMRDADGELVTCPQGLDCVFSWKQELTPEISTVSYSHGVITCTGYNLPLDSAQLEITLGGSIQTSITIINANQFTIAVTEFPTSTTTLTLVIKTLTVGYVYMAPGTATFTVPAAVFLGISRGEVSRGGSQIIINGENFTPDTQLSLVNEQGDPLCQNYEYLSITKMVCYTFSGDFNQQSIVVQQFLNSETITVNCTPDPESDAVCTFQTSEGVTPIVTNVEFLGLVEQFYVFKVTGTGFDVSEGTVNVQIMSNAAAEVIVVSSTELTVRFDHALGYMFNQLPQLQFGNGDFALIDLQILITITPPPVEPPTHVIVSPGGGSEYTFPGPGLGADPNLKVDVCGEPCVRNPDAETPDSVTCELPGFDTVHSVNEDPDSAPTQNLINSLKVELYNHMNSATDAMLAAAENVFDGQPATSYGQQVQGGCSVGLKMVDTEHQRMAFDQVRYMLAEDANPAQYLQGKFQASMTAD